MKHWKNTILSAALLAVLTATPAQMIRLMSGLSRLLLHWS